MANSVDPDQTAPLGAVYPGSTLFASILNSSINNVRQLFAADDSSRMHFFFSSFSLRVNSAWSLILHWWLFSKSYFFQKILSGTLSYCQMAWIQIICWFFSKWTLTKYSFMCSIRVSNSLDLDQNWHFIRPSAFFFKNNIFKKIPSVVP